MPITYTNRKGRLYYLCQATTKTGKPRYYFATEPKDSGVELLPAGYQIQESVNGIVSLSKVTPVLLSDADISAVKAALQAHPKSSQYRMDAKSKQITIYEHVGPNLMELGRNLTLDFGRILTQNLLQRLQQDEDRYSQFTPMMRFILTDNARHSFKAQRMCFFGNIDDWIDIDFDKPITELATKLIPKLGTEAFFELF